MRLTKALDGWISNLSGRIDTDLDAGEDMAEQVIVAAYLLARTALHYIASPREACELFSRRDRA